MQSKEFPWSKYKPMDGILVIQPVWITEREIQFLMQLYAPFIGKEATLLYATLYGELSPSAYQSEVFSISELLSMTNLGMPDFHLAKSRLEGIGLLKTYHKEPTASRPQTYTMELLAPTSPRLFFKDALLSTLLLNQVGNHRFEKLKQRFLTSNIGDLGDSTSAQFEEVYRLPYNMESYTRNFSQEKRMVMDVKQQSPMEFSSEVDWELIEGLLKTEFVDLDSLTKEVKRIVDVLYKAYGFSESEIAQFLVIASDLSTKVIDEEFLLKLGQEAAQNKVNLMREKEEHFVAEEIKEKSESHEEVSSVEDDAIGMLIQAAKELSPIDFVSSIKTQKKGYVSKAERQLIFDLVSVSGLPNEVLNILFHYALVQLDNATLARNFIDAIANDWAAKGIQSAKEAIDAVRNRDLQREVKRKQQLHNAGKNNYRKNSGYQEQLPEWAKESKAREKQTSTPNKSQSEQVSNDLADQIAKLKTSQQKEQQ